MDAVRSIRYWAHCAQDTTIQFEPIDLDQYIQRVLLLDDFGTLAEVPAEDFEFRQGHG